MSPLRPPAFSLQQIVQRVNQPEAVGLVRDARWDEQAESYNYSVQFGAQLRVVPEEALQLFVPIQSVWDALQERRYSGARRLVYALTHHRLRRPPTRAAHSFATARTQFFPHQFKPLLKFLDHPSQRILIADDVGLGKTIEAGYILLELQARQPLERVLILAPARLTAKWRSEMRNRFGESFEIASRQALLSLAGQVQQGREPDPFRLIVSYETARADDVRESLERTQLPIDLLIADEAHRMRNPESLQHKLGTTLCRQSDSVVFLSATPVQNRLDDLWQLLRLLSPLEFADFALFGQQLAANQSLLQAQAALSVHPAESDRAKQAFEAFLASDAGTLLQHTELTRSICFRLDQDALERREVVELQADLGRLNPVGHVLTRTRKSEAIPNRAVRAAHWHLVPLSARERKIYESVEQLCRLAQPGTGWGFQMSLLMAYRITASCIPAAVQYFERKLQDHAAPSMADVLEDGSDGTTSTPWAGEPRARIQALVDLLEGDGADSKRDCLLQALTDIWQEDQNAGRKQRKVVVFSYFRNTLEYLLRALQQRRVACRMIHGGIRINEREQSIDEFLNADEVVVLLTSDVGGEGIDLQKASVLVNYDLPWNPMVVEQRIGRIDRIGQESPRMVILNLVVEGSVEERVLCRLLNKIGIFESSIGELDAVIGEQIEELAAHALSGTLRPSELEQAVEATGDALERRVREAHEMLSRVDGLLAADHALLDEINAITGERQLPTEAETLDFINASLAQQLTGYQLPSRACKEIVSADLRGLAVLMERSSSKLGVDVGAFGRRLAAGPIQLTLSREAAYRHPRAELVHLRHPLTLFAVSLAADPSHNTPVAYAVRLRRSAVLPPGEYAFLVSLLELQTHRSVARFAAAFANLRHLQKVWYNPEETSTVLVELLESAVDTEPPLPDDNTLRRAQTVLTDAIATVVSDWSEREQRLDIARQHQRHAARSASLHLSMQRARERLDTLEARNAQDFAVRMARARLQKAEREVEEFLDNPPRPTWTGIEQEELAVGILIVGDTPCAYT